jgi:hypothetical protein
MKTYKVMRSYKPVGNAGDKVQLKQDRFTEQLLAQGIITELKVVEPEETKTTKRKPRAKKAD